MPFFLDFLITKLWVNLFKLTVPPFLAEVVFFLYPKHLFAQSLGLALNLTLDTVVLVIHN